MNEWSVAEGYDDNVAGGTRKRVILRKTNYQGTVVAVRREPDEPAGRRWSRLSVAILIGFDAIALLPLFLIALLPVALLLAGLLMLLRFLSGWLMPAGAYAHLVALLSAKAITRTAAKLAGPTEAVPVTLVRLHDVRRALQHDIRVKGVLSSGSFVVGDQVTLVAVTRRGRVDFDHGWNITTRSPIVRRPDGARRVLPWVTGFSVLLWLGVLTQFSSG